MLFKKTLKAASAAALWMVALVGATSAMAIDLDKPVGPGNAPPTFSAEALGASPTGVYTVNHADDLAATTSFGTLAGVLNRAGPVYIRVDVGGVLALRSTPAMTLGDGAASGEPRTNSAAPRNQTSVPTQQHLIYTVDTDPTAEASDTIMVNFEGAAGVTGLGTGTVRVRAYDSIRDAVHGNDADLLDKSGPLLAVARSIRVVPSAGTRSTATVDTGFRQFEAFRGAGYRQPIASLTLAVDCHRGAEDGAFLNTAPNGPACVPGAAAAGGTMPSLASVNVNADSRASGGSSLAISGDGGFAFAAGVGFYPAAGCTGTARGASFPKVDGADNKAGPVMGDVAEMGAYNLCVTMAPTNAERIEQGSYTADVNLVALQAGMPFLPMGGMDLAVGTIVHDGTTVQIPYLTSYEYYTQRLVIVNRNKQDVAYTLRFHTEGSGTADPMMVEGMAAGSGTTIIKIADVVTLMNPTRASGTLEIVSNPSRVSVATTMVNKMDMSTDTVVLEAE